eukprot:scaffold26048_cov49-Prasinocladus_malaysianus.AAC.1
MERRSAQGAEPSVEAEPKSDSLAEEASAELTSSSGVALGSGERDCWLEGAGLENMIATSTAKMAVQALVSEPNVGHLQATVENFLYYVYHDCIEEGLMIDEVALLAGAA